MCRFRWTRKMKNICSWCALHPIIHRIQQLELQSIYRQSFSSKPSVLFVFLESFYHSIFVFCFKFFLWSICTSVDAFKYDAKKISTKKRQNILTNNVFTVNIDWLSLRITKQTSETIDWANSRQQHNLINGKCKQSFCSKALTSVQFSSSSSIENNDTIEHWASKRTKKSKVDWVKNCFCDHICARINNDLYTPHSKTLFF